METPLTIQSIIQYPEPIPSGNVFKVCILNDMNTIRKMIVFQGSDKPVGKDDVIFSDDEKRKYEVDDFAIQSSTFQIHPDDSIQVLKMKILHELNIPHVSYDELYLFSTKNLPINIHELYMELTQNDTVPLSKQILGQLLRNLQIYDQDTLSYFAEIPQSVYTYTEFISGLAKYSHNMVLTIPIGQRFATTRELLFSANPYNVLQTNPLVFHASNTNPLLTFDNSLLMTYGKCINNTIYVCLTDDVFKYSERKTISGDYFVKLYYPFLAKKDILSSNDLIENRPVLMKQTNSYLKPAIFQKYKNKDMFYEIYTKRLGELAYSKDGIDKFNLVLHPISPTLFPLEVVFKQIHTSPDIPYIKYNPGHRREPLYRIYTLKRTKQGKLVPELSRSQILSYSKISGKPNQLSFVIYYIHENVKEHVFVHISLNGDIIVTGTSTNPLSVDNLNTILLTTVNPLLTKINDILDSSGYAISLFQDVYDERLEYINLNYISSIPRNSHIKPVELTTLLSNMFHIYEADINKGAILRFKNVDNYKEMTAMNALITQIYKTTNDLDQVKQSIMNNFEMTEEDARQVIMKYLNEHLIINGQYVNKSIDVAENPGFPCLMRISTTYATPEIVIEIAEINSIYYIDLIRKYLDVFLRVTQYQDMSHISKDKLLKIMAKTKSVDDVVINDTIVSTVTQPIQPYGVKPAYKLPEDTAELDEEDMLYYDDNDELDENDKFDEPAETHEEDDSGLLFQDDDADENDDKLFMGGTRMFFNKMKKLEPTLFRTKKEGKFDSYARICPSQSSRQPVILTKEELDALDESTYEVAMPYGTNKDKPYWYMCPRYWCLQTNKPMTDKQVADGECGGKVIPQVLKNKNPPPGHYIYEFTDDRQHKDANDNYRQHRPGFWSAKSQQDSCIPCCFKEMNSAQQIGRRQACGVMDSDLRGKKNVINKLITPDDDGVEKEEEELGEDTDNIADEDVEPDAEKVDDDAPNTPIKPDKIKPVRVGMNVLGFDKFPIDKSRWGFLPLSVELFLRTNNSTSVSKNNPALIKQNETPLLRYGVEYSHNQSFIACIADLYTYHNNVPVPSIAEMRKIIISKISLDTFVKSNNGSLVALFQPKKTSIDDITVDKYKTTEIYKSLTDLANNAQNRFLKDTIASYQKFIAFLQDDDSFIDHTYMWDILTSAETDIFKNGINIAIIEILDNDITDNVAVLCPSNVYTATLFDRSKGTVILLKHNNFYEPIYSYGNTNTSKTTKKNAVKIFYQQNTPPNLLNVFDMINKTTNKYCKPKASLPTVYDYKTNISAQKIYEILTNNRLVVKNQVQNYRNQVIAFTVSTRMEDEIGIYVPTSPSGIIKNIPVIFTDSVTWQDYEITRDRLTQISNKTNGAILCKPAFKVIEDKMIVGIFTETNQFIQVKEPVENIIEDGVPEYDVHGYKNSQYYNADKAFATDTSVDSQRVQSIRNLSLESYFYNLFRSKLRLVLADYKYNVIREEIIHIINDKQPLYKTKMKKLDIIIRHLLGPIVTFIKFDEDVLKQLDNMKTNINADEIKNICMLKGKQMCVPHTHLVSGVDNEPLYYSRLADELIRYNRIRTFILDKSKYLNFGNIEYQINNNEMLYIHSLLVTTDFDKLLPMRTNKYIETMPTEFVNPIQSTYSQISPDIPLTEQYKNTVNATFDILKTECVSKTGPVLTGKKNWREILQENSVEHIMTTSVQCSFYIIIYILREHLQIHENIHDIKQRLCNYYKVLMETYLLKICDILSKQGKREFVNMLKRNQIDINIMIMNDSYVMTAMDIWVIAMNMQLPIIMFDSNESLSFAPNIDWIRLGGNPETDKFYFIRMISNTQYNLITPPIYLRDMNGFQQIIQSTKYNKHIQTFQEFIQNYEITAPKLNVRKPRMQKLLPNK